MADPSYYEILTRAINDIAQHGYDGLLIATLLAGIMLVAAGWAQLGTWIKYIPQPVITGFTAGIALVISWFAAIYFTPWIGYRLLKVHKQKQPE